MMDMALPKAFGTMRAIPSRPRRVKCKTRTKRNITAKAQRVDATQEASAVTPSAPAARNSSSETTSTPTTIMCRIATQQSN
jgi:hypothetical protein